MNERYLYKAKRIDNGEWAYGYFVKIQEEAYIIVNAEKQSLDGGETADLYATEWYQIETSTLCQCTGIADKNGKLIWENDIVAFEDLGETGYEYKEGFDFTNRAKVIWNNGRFELDCFAVSWNSAVIEEMNDCHEDFYNEFKRMEVIGNIFDNPELLG